MANVQAFCSLFMTEALDATHDLSVDTIKAALYLTTANIGLHTTQYTSTGEVSGLNYVAGGIVVDSTRPPLVAGKVTYWTPGADIVFSNVTLLTSFNAALLYNASKSNKALGVWTFSATTVNLANFTLRVPSNTVGAALLRWKSQ